jgi:long-chain acyl-CoA synthetase
MNVTPYLEVKPAPHAVFDCLEERAERPRFMVPEADGGWRPVSWQAFADEIREIALCCAEAGLEPGDRAAVFAPNRVEWLSAALGIQAAGGVMVPIYAASTSEQAAYVIDHSDAKLLFVDTPALLERALEALPQCPKLLRVVLLDATLDAKASYDKLRKRGVELPSFEQLSAKVIGWSEARAAGNAAHRSAPERFAERLAAIELDDVGLMLYTSGTTGAPKGVPLTHRNVGVNGRDWLECNAPLLEEGDVDVLWLPMSHIFGFGEACAGNMLGWTSYLADPSNALTVLPEVQPTVFMSVPAYWEKIALAIDDTQNDDHRQRAFEAVTGGRLRFSLSGGAGLKPEVKEKLHRLGLLIIEGYGLTECSPTLTLNRPHAFRFDTVGMPLPSLELKLADDGEILARGDNVFGGYHKNPEATREAFSDDGWFKTGDIGRFTDDGFLRIVDRKKEILVTAGGKNVPPANIELRFADDPLVLHAVVYGDGKKYLTAGLWLNWPVVEEALDSRDVSNGKRQKAIEQLLQRSVDRVNGGLARFEHIKRFTVIDTPLTVEKGLLTSTLKVRRKKVYQAFRELFESLYR